MNNGGSSINLHCVWKKEGCAWSIPGLLYHLEILISHTITHSPLVVGCCLSRHNDDDGDAQSGSAKCSSQRTRQL